MDNLFEVRDYRNKSMFKVDDEYLNGYARLLGTNATLVYLCLCRHADRYQESFPSVNGMAEKLGISDDSVSRGIKNLVEWNIISKERERRTNKTWLNNRYVLLDKSVWKAKPASHTANSGLDSHTANTSDATPQIAGDATPQLTGTKDTHRYKETHIKDTHTASECDISFEEFWKAYPRKVGKGAADKAWRKIRPSKEIALKITDSLSAHIASPEWQRDDGRFIPHPATYLNQERWLDELTDAPKVINFKKY